MRSPLRIAPALRVVEAVWQEMPDMRLGQLLLNAASCAQMDLWEMECSDIRRGLELLSAKWSKTRNEHSANEGDE